MVLKSQRSLSGVDLDLQDTFNTSERELFAPPPPGPIYLAASNELR